MLHILFVGKHQRIVLHSIHITDFFANVKISNFAKTHEFVFVQTITKYLLIHRFEIAAGIAKVTIKSNYI